MYKIRNKPTGLYWQPRKSGGNHLSPHGKIYANRGTAKRVVEQGINRILMSSRSRVLNRVLKAYPETEKDESWIKVFNAKNGDWEVVNVRAVYQH